MTEYLLIHGFTGAPLAWARVVERLQRPAHCPQLGGHAGLVPTARSFVEEVDRIAAWTLERTASPVHLAGYSLGGRIALGLLVRHPSLISSATIIGAHPGLEPDQRSARVDQDESWAAMLEHQGLPAFLDAWEKLPLWSTQGTVDPAIAEEQRRWRRSHDATGLAWALRTLGLGRMPSWREHLPRIDQPTTFIAGDADPKFSLLAESMAGLTRCGRFLSFPRCGHNVVLEQPDALGTFLREAIP